MQSDKRVADTQIVDSVTDKELREVFENLATDSTVTKLKIEKVTDAVTKETIIALIKMLKENVTLSELYLGDLDPENCDKRLQKNLIAAIKNNSNLRQLQFNFLTKDFVSFYNERNKLLIQGIGYLIQNELIVPTNESNFKKMLNEVMDFDVFIQKSLEGSPTVTSELQHKKLELLKQNLIDLSNTNQDATTFANALLTKIDDLLEYIEIFKGCCVEMGATLLHIAAASGMTEQVDKLTQSGFSPDVVDADGDTPLVYAEKAEESDTAAFLEQLTTNKNKEPEEKNEYCSMDTSTKKLYVIFGIEKLKAFMNENDKPYLEGNFREEGYDILVENLNKYKEKLDPTDKSKIEIIIKAFNSLPKEKAPNQNKKMTFLEAFRLEKNSAMQHINKLITSLMSAKEGDSYIIPTGFAGMKLVH